MKWGVSPPRGRGRSHPWPGQSSAFSQRLRTSPCTQQRGPSLPQDNKAPRSLSIHRVECFPSCFKQTPDAFHRPVKNGPAHLVPCPQKAQGPAQPVKNQSSRTKMRGECGPLAPGEQMALGVCRPEDGQLPPNKPRRCGRRAAPRVCHWQS